MKNDFLNIIRQATEDRLKNTTTAIADLKNQAACSRIPQNFLDIFNPTRATPHHETTIIAEIKLKDTAMNHIEIANAYLSNGASAISVPTEPNYFQGSLNYLQEIRQAFPKSFLLMKDFIIDELQLLQARLYGADAVLLIVDLLTINELKALHAQALALGLTPLVEVHTSHELYLAEFIGAKFVAINNRNPRTLKADLSVSLRLIQKIKTQLKIISASGISSGSEIKHLQKHGCNGFLIGSHLMTSQNPGFTLKKLLYA